MGALVGKLLRMTTNAVMRFHSWLGPSACWWWLRWWRIRTCRCRLMRWTNDDGCFSASGLGRAFAGCELNSRLEWKAFESDTEDVQLTSTAAVSFRCCAVLVTNPSSERASRPCRWKRSPHGRVEPAQPRTCSAVSDGLDPAAPSGWGIGSGRVASEAGPVQVHCDDGSKSAHCRRSGPVRSLLQASATPSKSVSERIPSVQSKSTFVRGGDRLSSELSAR